MPRNFDRRGVLLGSLMAATAAAAELYVPRRSSPRLTDAKFEAIVPNKVGSWNYLAASGLILPPEDQLSKTLYEQLMTRVYGNGSSAVMLVMAYSSIQEGRLQVHRPEICYPAAGFTIVSQRAIDIPLDGGSVVPAKFLIAERGARQECILYWTRVGPFIPRRWFEQRLIMAQANIQGYIPDGLLARVSIVANDPAEALRTLIGFVQTLVSTAKSTDRRFMVGAR